MAIKWENIKILHSPLTNNIYLGKLDKTGKFATDKSKDRTDEMISIVARHLDGLLKDGENGAEVEFEAGTLTWVRKEGDKK